MFQHVIGKIKLIVNWNAAAKKYPNLTIIKWHEFAGSHQDWFYDDHTHPTTAGSKYYSAYVTKMLVTKGKY